jgi:hypothetical protein
MGSSQGQLYAVPNLLVTATAQKGRTYMITIDGTR